MLLANDHLQSTKNATLIQHHPDLNKLITEDEQMNEIWFDEQQLLNILQISKRTHFCLTVVDKLLLIHKMLLSIQIGIFSHSESNEFSMFNAHCS